MLFPKTPPPADISNRPPSVTTPYLAKNALAFYTHFVKRQWKDFLFLRATDVIHYAHFIILPFLIKFIIDGLTTSGHNLPEVLTAVSWPLTGYVTAIIVAELLHVWAGWYSTKSAPRIRLNVRTEVLRYVLQHSDQYFSDQFAGTVGRRITELAESCYRVLTNIFHMLWSIACAVTIALGVLYYTNALIASILLVWVVIYMALTYIFAKNIQHKNRLFSAERSLLNGHIVDVISNIKSVKYFAREPFEYTTLCNEINHETKTQSAALMATEYASFFRRFATFVLATSLFAVLIWFWTKQQITLGDISMTTTIVLLVRGYAWSIGQHISNLFEEMGLTEEALQILKKPIDVTDKEDATELLVSKGHISIQNMSFWYEYKDQTIFKNLSIDIMPGQKVGLVGHSGAGKSTLVNLLLRFYDIQAGHILLDGTDIAEITQTSLRQAISVIPQDTSLFHRSLMENIRYGRLDATDEEVIAAAKQAHAHEFIAMLPEGYKTLVGERGIKLSGGQRQRIAIARAILKDAPILILDEATSALDSESERFIQKSLQQLMKGKTVIAIAHRLSTIKHLDRLIVMEQGRIVEDGSHNTLLKQDKTYAKLWHMQSGGFIRD